METIKKIASKTEGKFWLAVITFIFLIALGSSYIIPFKVDESNRAKLLSAPDSSNWFGTDRLGRDVFSRTVVGIKTSLYIGFAARTIALIIGVITGLAAAYYGGLADNLISRVVDSTLAFPSLLLAIAISVLFRPDSTSAALLAGQQSYMAMIRTFIGQGYTPIIISLFLVSWAPITRLIRSAAIQVINLPFIEAARSYGAGDIRILFMHILPNCSSTIIVAFTSGIATTIMSESSLNFLGLGPDSSFPTIGQMIYAGLQDINSPWVILFPSLFLLLLIFSFNILGDMLRDALDPREN